MKAILLIAYLCVVCSNGYNSYCDKINNYHIPIYNKIDDAVVISGILQRVMWIHDHLAEFTCKENGIYDDYYHGDTRVKRDFYLTDNPAEKDSTVMFDMFYDESGKLIYVYVRHYRDANYGIYFQNDELFFVKVGPFHRGDPYLAGNLEQAKAFIENHERYSFVLDDLDVCMKDAYRSESFFSKHYLGEESWDDMKFSSKKTVDKLKSIYHNLSFYEGFKTGDLSVYDDYAEKYTRLLKSEAEFYEAGNYYDLSFVGDNVETLKRGFADGDITCLMFDMDEDGMPELYLSDVYGAYVFKYIPESDQYVTWWTASGGNYQMLGSRRTGTIYLDGERQFDQLDKSGKKECSIFFGTYNTGNGETIYLLSLPTYQNGLLNDDMIEEMKEDGYYDGWYCDGDRGRCFFRVTQDEYNDVTKPFFDAERQAAKESENFTFTPNLD